MTTRRRAPTSWLDAASIAASGACLIHCLMLPILFALLPAAADMVAVPESFHLLAVAIALPASALAMVGGYRHHGLWHPALIGLVGFALIGAGVMASDHMLLETGLSVAGGTILASGHVLNWRLRLHVTGRPATRR